MIRAVAAVRLVAPLRQASRTALSRAASTNSSDHRKGAAFEYDKAYELGVKKEAQAKLMNDSDTTAKIKGTAETAKHKIKVGGGGGGRVR